MKDEETQIDYRDVPSVGELQSIICSILINEPLYLHAFSRVRKYFSKRIPTACVYWDKFVGDYVILFNPDFFNFLKKSETPNKALRCGIMKHEILHMILNHTNSPRTTSFNAFLWNIAFDLSINTMIERESLPDCCLFPGEGDYAFLEKDKSSNYYFDVLKKLPSDGNSITLPNGAKQEMPSVRSGNGAGSGSSSGKLDEHLTSEEIDKLSKQVNSDNGVDFDENNVAGESEQERQKEETSESIAQGMKNAKDAIEHENRIKGKNAGVGTCPIDSILGLINARRRIDPTRIIRSFLATSLSPDKEQTWRRLDRRRPWELPGSKRVPLPNIAISFDQSGSMSDDLIRKCFEVIDQFSKYINFTVIPFDYDVFEPGILKYKRGDKLKKVKRDLAGGTCFEPATQYVNKKMEFDGHIVLTDLGAPFPSKSRCKRLWITTEQYKSFGENFIPPNSKDRIVYFSDDK